MASNSDETVTKNVDAPTYVPSLPVRVDPLQVPERYVRNQEDRSQLNEMSDLSSEVPVMGLSRLTMGDLEELDKLDLACKKWGFFQVVHHGVVKEMWQKMKKAATEFLELPIEQKNKYAMPSDDIQGYGHAYVVSEQQVQDRPDALILFERPPEHRKLNFWPNTPEGFREITDAYPKETKNVGKELLHSISTIMGMDNPLQHTCSACIGYKSTLRHKHHNHSYARR